MSDSDKIHTRIEELITELVELMPHWDTMIHVDATDAQMNQLAELITGMGLYNNGRAE
jgi:hypothetical protein